jgi:F-type H+-transporting ATPase subunit delta
MSVSDLAKPARRKARARTLIQRREAGAKPDFPGLVAASGWLRAYPPYDTGSAGFQGNARQTFRLLTRKRHFHHFGSGGEAAQERPLGRRGVQVAGEVDTSSGVAGRYATALFELALEQRALDQVAADLDRFNQALDASADLLRLIKSPVFSAEEQGRALEAVLAPLKIEGLTRNFLLLAAKNRRLFATPDMIRAFRAMLARHRGETSATVIAAAKLTESQLTALKQALKAALGNEVMLEERVDPALLGGLVVKVGSRMVDTSLRTKLNSLKVAMKEVG